LIIEQVRKDFVTGVSGLDDIPEIRFF